MLQKNRQRFGQTKQGRICKLYHPPVMETKAATINPHPRTSNDSPGIDSSKPIGVIRFLVLVDRAALVLIGSWVKLVPIVVGRASLG